MGVDVWLSEALAFEIQPITKRRQEEGRDGEKGRKGGESHTLTSDSRRVARLAMARRFSLRARGFPEDEALIPPSLLRPTTTEAQAQRSRFVGLFSRFHDRPSANVVGLLALSAAAFFLYGAGAIYRYGNM